MKNLSIILIAQRVWLSAMERRTRFLNTPQLRRYSGLWLFCLCAVLTTRANDATSSAGATAGNNYHELRIYTVTSNKLDGL